MGQSELLSSLYQNHSESVNIRTLVFPDLAAGVVLTGAKAYAYGAWVQIVAAAGVVVDTWISGVELAEGLAGGDQYQVQVGSGAGAAEVGLAAIPFDSRNGSGGQVDLPLPIKVLAATRIAARTANAAAGAANTIIAKVKAIQGLV
ncbi:hypothetical protein LCGC14_1754860 [marine sediment metagenome]|uniref:Uncharacterized protein n=1 Tax=marine sediment metagenome TaxID=412755 RepID=A0A0F9JHZ3_9ZZZZ